MQSNFIVNCDSYKCSHHRIYPSRTQFVYSYIESRGGEWDRVVFFGLQMFIKEYLLQPITQADIDEAQDIFDLHLGAGIFNREGWEYILRKHGGLLPVAIRAVPEGTVVPGKNVLCTIVNTDPECYWLTSYLETALMRIWYPITVSTLSYHCKKIIYAHLIKTCDDPDTEIEFKLHDFGARGVSSGESAAIGGLAHLVHFKGTDTVSALVAGRRYYNEKMVGFSVPASEHSTITSWVDGSRDDITQARHEGEVAAYRNMLRQFGKPGAMLACVSDSYDIYNAVANLWGGTLKNEVLEMGGRLVVRPDSGRPSEVVLKCVELLGEKFGFTVNHKGYKVLHPAVRVIQGDGITIKSIDAILTVLTNAGWSAENVAFGMGGGLLQQVNRDTLRFAMKCSAVCVDGVWRDVYKAPVTDPGKRSKKGQLALITESGYYETVPLHDNAWRDTLQEVYRDGNLLREVTFEEVRVRAAQPMLGDGGKDD